MEYSQILALEALLEFYFDDDVLNVEADEIFRIIRARVGVLPGRSEFWLNALKECSPLKYTIKLLKYTSFISHFCSQSSDNKISELYIRVDRVDRPGRIIRRDKDYGLQYFFRSVIHDSVDCMKWLLCNLYNEEIHICTLEKATSYLSQSLTYRMFKLLEERGCTSTVDIYAMIYNEDIDLIFYFVREMETVETPVITHYIRREKIDERVIGLLVEKSEDVHSVVEEFIIEIYSLYYPNRTEFKTFFAFVEKSIEMKKLSLEDFIDLVALYFSPATFKIYLQYIVNHRDFKSCHCILIAVTYENKIMLEEFLNAGGDASVKWEQTVGWLRNRASLLRIFYRAGVDLGGREGKLWKDCERFNSQESLGVLKKLYK